MTMLNLQQEMAVKTTSRITYVNAGAGTGKIRGISSVL